MKVHMVHAEMHQGGIHSNAMCEAAMTRRRKSPQWFGLLRPHAQVIASDDVYIELFRQHCVARRLVKGKCALPHPDGRQEPLTPYFDPLTLERIYQAS